jgi:hypothetical protein
MLPLHQDGSLPRGELDMSQLCLTLPQFGHLPRRYGRKSYLSGEDRNPIAQKELGFLAIVLHC